MTPTEIYNHIRQDHHKQASLANAERVHKWLHERPCDHQHEEEPQRGPECFDEECQRDHEEVVSGSTVRYFHLPAPHGTVMAQVQMPITEPYADLLVQAAKMLHAATDGISDEQTWSQINAANEAYGFIRSLPLEIRQRCGDGFPWLIGDEV